MCKVVTIRLAFLVSMFMSSLSHAVEIDEAMAASNKHLVSMKIDLKNYKLVSAQNISINGKKYIGPKSWFFYLSGTIAYPRKWKYTFRERR